MTKVKQFNRDTCRLVAAQLMEGLQDIAEELGLSVRARGGQFSDTVYTMKIEVGVVGGDGKPATREGETLRDLGGLIGIPAEKVGAVFTVSGVDYRLTGMRARAGKYPLIAERTDDGRRFKFEVERVRAALGLPQSIVLGHRGKP